MNGRKAKLLRRKAFYMHTRKAKEFLPEDMQKEVTLDELAHMFPMATYMAHIGVPTKLNPTCKRWMNKQVKHGRINKYADVNPVMEKWIHGPQATTD